MNLQQTFSQNIPFLFGFKSSSTDEEILKTSQEYNKQGSKLLETEKVEPKLKDNLVLREETVAVIGRNGVHRFNEFKTYPDGWYGGKGKEISNWSIAIFERFVKEMPELKRFHPSLFLTLEGNISLGWKDRTGQSVEVEFYPDKIEYFIESLNEESTVTLANIYQFTEKIKKLLK